MSRSELTRVEAALLGALVAVGPSDGLALVELVRERTGGAVLLDLGSTCALLAGLEADGFIETRPCLPGGGGPFYDVAGPCSACPHVRDEHLRKRPAPCDHGHRMPLAEIVDRACDPTITADPRYGCLCAGFCPGLPGQALLARVLRADNDALLAANHALRTEVSGLRAEVTSLLAANDALRAVPKGGAIGGA